MKLSVCLITYNHAKYISEAIDSILKQVVDFEYEIVIGEDCSTDNTRIIIQEYRDKHPEIIRLILRDKNVGHIENFIQTYKSCKGKYIATLDGDDYWISPYKLQRQVDFLENNSDFAIVFHQSILIDEIDGSRTGQKWPVKPKDEYNIEDLLRECFIQTAAVVCRNGLFNEFPKWIHTVIMEDWSLHLLNAEHGKIKYLNNITSAYRLHAGGIWSCREKTSTYIEFIKFYKTINTHFKGKYNDIIKLKLKYYYCALAHAYYELAIKEENNRNTDIARGYAKNSIVYNICNRKIDGVYNDIRYKEKIKLILRLYYPELYRKVKGVKLLVKQ